jgi:hypothetical protein
MSMFDFCFRMLRCSLPENLYQAIRKCPAGRYRQKCTLQSYKSIFSHYDSQGINFTDKTIVEMGPGPQFFTALYFLRAGAKEVILVDPQLKGNVGALLQDHLAEFTRAEQAGFLDTGRIGWYTDIAQIPGLYNHAVDFICSNAVLEHVKQPHWLFANVSRLLSDTGVSFNAVDLTDHSYHIFAERKWFSWLFSLNVLRYLRYSDTDFGKVNDNRTYMNRLLLPYYLEAVRKYGLQVAGLRYVLSRTMPKIHEDVLSHFSSRSVTLLSAMHFSLILTKAMTT